MFTESMLRKHPALVRAFTGIPAEEFWDMLEKMEAQLPAYEKRRHTREGRERAIGAGRKFDQSLAQRTVAVLSYLRLHIPQLVIAFMFGLTQCDISRDLRRLLPLIASVLPCPEIWDIVKDAPETEESVTLLLEQLADGRVLVDATEQQVFRPSKDNKTRKLYYSGKKKAFTVKTQMVTDGEHHIQAISVSVPGAMHDKKLSDEVQTVERLPDGCEADADKGYQGMTDQVSLITLSNPETGLQQKIPRLTVCIPFKKLKGKELTEQQEAFNSQLSAVRVRVEHCIGWVKNWAIIATRFRCSHSIYTSIMHTVCGLVNEQTRRWQMARLANCA
ncbi:transposase family protein [Methylocucumis oryzae]|uniref:DDE Tnp4 domain-containing protein n=1 Tax=Methylocucumis oryzae TaxID=1632867 RepID=A0A0F3IE47_9GAMM|nr:transposase family protein [Methylocucumis oryzae]KJV04952.1 hypothetical protein VZ94_21695 [Methylocucumis oryzae]